MVALTHLRRLPMRTLCGLLALWLAWPLTAVVRAADPLRVVLLVDSSTTMATMITEFRAGLHAFIDDLPDNVEVAFISAGGQIRIRTQPTTDKQLLNDAVSRFASDGGANSFLDTMIESDRRFLKTARNRRPLFVIVTTDQPSLGDPRIYAYNAFMHDFVGRRGRAHAVVIRGTQSGLASTILDNLTQNTDGIFATMAVANSLPARMKQIAAEVAAQQ